MNRFIVWLPVLAAVMSCSPPDLSGNAAADASNEAAKAPTRTPVVAAAAGAGGACALRWNGQPATREAVLDGAVRHIEQAIEAIGGIEHITEASLPVAAIEAESKLPFLCASEAFAALRQAGFAGIELRQAGSDEARPPRVRMPAGDDRPWPQLVVALGAPGSISLNHEALGLEALRQRIASDAANLAGPDDLVILASGDTPYGEVRDVAAAFNLAGHEPMLIGCRAAYPAPPNPGQPPLDPPGAALPDC